MAQQFASWLGECIGRTYKTGNSAAALSPAACDPDSPVPSLLPLEEDADYCMEICKELLSYVYQKFDNEITIKEKISHNTETILAENSIIGN